LYEFSDKKEISDGNGESPSYLRCMTSQELIAYFESAKLPETLRLDRACTQHDVKESVARNLETMRLDNDNGRAKHRLTQIMNALETPYDGPGIPNL